MALGFAGCLLTPAAPVSAWSYGVANTTQRPGDTGNGCASCHGSAPGTISVQVQGPDALLPGVSANYSIVVGNISIASARGGFTAAVTRVPGRQATFANVAGEPTATVDSLTQIVQNNSGGPLRLPSSGTVTYLVNLSMPASAILGDEYVIYTVGDAGHGTTQNGWNFGSDYTIIAGPPAPVTLVADQESASTTEIPLSWSGSDQGEHFRVLSKTGGFPDSPNDPLADLIYEGPDTFAVATDLTPGTRYFFAAYGKVPDEAFYSSQAAQADAASVPEDPLALTISPFSGSDITLIWGGSGTEYRLLRKIGSFPSGPEDTEATLVYEGSDTSANDSELLSNAEYHYRVWSKVPDLNVFSANSSEVIWIDLIHSDRFESDN